MNGAEHVTSEPYVKREELEVAIGLWKFSDDVLDEFSAGGVLDGADEVPSSHAVAFVPSSFLRGRRLAWVIIVSGMVLAFTLGHLVAMTGPRNHVRSILSGGPTGTAAFSSSPTNSPAGTIPTKGATVTNVLVVDVQGDVLHPGIVHLGPDARVMDAVAAAGGFKHPDDASKVNLAAPVNDGDEVVIPYNVQQTEGVGTGKSLIDLNTADEATLETIPGIGPSKASSIIAYRNAHGPFSSVNDLLSIHGIGAVTLSHIAPYVTIIGGQ